MATIPTFSEGDGWQNLDVPRWNGMAFIPWDTSDIVVDADVSDVVRTGDVRTARVTTGSIGGTGSATVTVTWATPFADTNYTVTAQVVSDQVGASTGLRLNRIRTVTAEGITVSVDNPTLGSLTGTVHAVAFAD